jgi:hypothetical protein
MHGRDENAYNIMVGNTEGKRLIGRLMCVWEDNIKMDLREMVWTAFIWLMVGSSGGCCKHSIEPVGSIKGDSFLD